MNWYRMLNTRGIGPEGRMFNPNRFSRTRLLNSRIVAVKTDTIANDCHKNKTRIGLISTGDNHEKRSFEAYGELDASKHPF